jgi:hypothetical protein
LRRLDGFVSKAEYSPQSRTCLPAGRKDAKITASLTEVTEEKILFVCPEKPSGQTKRLFWRIGGNPEPDVVWGLSPILQKPFFLCDLRDSAVNPRNYLWN